jgi:hypothetical protein
MKIDEFCRKLDDTLASLTSREVRIEAAAKFIALAFSVGEDEVALFLLESEMETLRFIWPPWLKNAGSIPLSASNPLAAQTARENRAMLNNAFASLPHASFFELFRTDNGRPLPIQKIMSAPLAQGGMVKGVIQVSRKGEEIPTAGNDFSQNDLLHLQSAAASIAGYL